MSHSGVRLRQVVFASRRRDEIIALLQSAFALEPSLQIDSGPEVDDFGIRTAVVPIGTQFVEVLEPRSEDVAAARFLTRLGHDGGYMLIFQVPDVEQARGRVQTAGVRIVWDGTPDFNAFHLHPKDVGGILIALAQTTPPESWAEAGADWESKVNTRVVSGIEDIRFACASPSEVCGLWSTILGVEPSADRTLPVDDAQIFFEQAVGADGLTSVGLTSSAGAPSGAVVIGGVRVRAGS